MHKISSIEGDLDTDLRRIQALLMIEKDFIDEVSGVYGNKNPPKQMIEKLASTLNNKYPFLQLDKLSAQYSEMYDLWTEKPQPIEKNH